MMTVSIVSCFFFCLYNSEITIALLIKIFLSIFAGTYIERSFSTTLTNHPPELWRDIRDYCASHSYWRSLKAVQIQTIRYYLKDHQTREF